MPQTCELGAQLLKVVDLSVVDDDHLLVARDHRLMPRRGEIDYRKPAMTKPDESVVEKTLTIGAAMGNGIRHFSEENRRNRLAVDVEDASDAAHASGLARNDCNS